MSETVEPRARPQDRSPDERSADHAAIDRLGAELLPALIAKLGATGLGELEVREGAWRVRLRRVAETAGTGPATARDWRAGERERGTRGGSSAGAHPVGGLTPVGPGHDGENGTGGRAAPIRDRDSRMAATSPAVGIFQPRPEARAGTRVRAGDRLGSVDMLGIPQVVVSPADGMVGASLVESGDAVEYGQELILIEFASAAPGEA